jgi:putative Ca2+/H+ antiporter (TMEM165/GDT1 family)
MIIFSEIGDKTFLVAALMAMRHDRLVVFSAAFSALITMTVLSAFLGHAVPTLIPKWLTNFLAAGLFLVFGVKMLFEARSMSPEDGVGEEMKEVEMELEEKEHQQRQMSRRRSSISPYILESGRAKSSTSRLPSPPFSGASSRDVSPSRTSSISNILNGVNNLFSLLLSPAWVQTFVMTFLGEWGDRSQIATIAMAAGQDYWYVIMGALVGHGCCTAGAVIGGKAIAGRISVKTGMFVHSYSPSFLGIYLKLTMNSHSDDGWCGGVFGLWLHLLVRSDLLIHYVLQRIREAKMMN